MVDSVPFTDYVFLALLAAGMVFYACLFITGLYALVHFVIGFVEFLQNRS